MQVDFYQLSRDPVEQVLPKIAARILDTGGRLLVVASERDKLETVSESLWSAGPASFLAHGQADEGNATIQPILLSTDCMPANGATHVALADGLWRDEALGFERAFHFFDAMTIEAARENWKALAAHEDVTRNFWRQDGGRWVKVA